MDRNKLYTLQEVADFLRLHPQSIYKLVRSKQLKSIKMIKEWRILGKDVLDFLKSKTA